MAAQDGVGELLDLDGVGVGGDGGRVAGNAGSEPLFVAVHFVEGDGERITNRQIHRVAGRIRLVGDSGAGDPDVRAGECGICSRARGDDGHEVGLLGLRRNEGGCHCEEDCQFFHNFKG